MYTVIQHMYIHIPSKVTVCSPLTVHGSWYVHNFHSLVPLLNLCLLSPTSLSKSNGVLCLSFPFSAFLLLYITSKVCNAMWNGRFGMFSSHEGSEIILHASSYIQPYIQLVNVNLPESCYS